jgi:hypothetical protein
MPLIDISQEMGRSIEALLRLAAANNWGGLSKTRCAQKAWKKQTTFLLEMSEFECLVANLNDVASS